MFSTIQTKVEEQICIITISRIDKLNALNKTVINELNLAMQEVYNNSAIRSAIITGAGEKSFVAGADISEFLDYGASEGEALARNGQTMVFNTIENCPKPVVAAVNGFALGGGCELALACHFIVASEQARFGQPEVNLGLIPGYGGTQRLVQVAGKGRAMQMLMSGQMITADEAMQYGIVNKVVPHKELLSETKSILQTIHTKAPVAISKIIECVNNFDHTKTGYELEITRFGECFATEDMKEGVTAFLEKRKPHFIGK